MLDNNGYRVLSLFAGIGGIDIGLEAHGCTTVAYSEVDPYACRVMAQHFPDAINLGDITTIDWEATRELGIDIICGGFPCQDISLAGKGAGIADGTRSGLWSHYADAIRVLRPRGVLVENVAALLARGIDRVLGDLAACGYDAEWDCIPAAAVGAPHLRDRVFLVAYRADARATSSDTALEHGGARGQGRAPALHEVRQPSGTAPAAGTDAERERGERRGEAGHLAGTSRAGQGEGDQRERDGDAPVDLRTVAPHAHHERCEERDGTTEPMGSQVAADRRTGRDPGWAQPRGSEWWRSEPNVGRMAHGIPDRMDRLRCLGNAVVPAVAEHVAGILIDRMEAA